VHIEPEDGGVRLVATDTYRLASRFVPGAMLGAEATIPAKTLAVLAEVHNAGDRIELWLGDDRPSHRGHAVLHTGPTSLDALLLTEKYPPWRNLVDVEAKAVGQLTVEDPAELAAAVLRNGRLFGGDLTLVHLDLTKGKVRAGTADQGEGSERVDIAWTGPELTITFNAGFLAEALRSFDGPAVAAITDDLKPVVLRPADDPGHDDLHLIMPVRSN
jgi:DNA polymerase-3 subunit beta